MSNSPFDLSSPVPANVNLDWVTPLGKPLGEHTKRELQKLALYHEVEARTITACNPDTQSFMRGFFLGVMLPAFHKLTTAEDVADHLGRHLPAITTGRANIDGEEDFYEDMYNLPTIGDEIDWRTHCLAKEGVSMDACGGWQLPREVLRAQAARMGMTDASAFNAEVDTRIAREVLSLTGLDAYCEGELDLQEFTWRLSLAWSGLDPIIFASAEQQAA